MNLPEIFSARMKAILGEEYAKFEHSFDQDIVTTIRINSSKYSEKNRLAKVPFCDTGFFLPQRPLFTLDPFIHSGVYYVQECSSMFLEQAINQLNLKGGIKVLDLCASPGGKSTHLSSLLPENSLLVSNDVIRSRSQILSENLKKWGDSSVIVTNNDPYDFQRLPHFFDIIVIDAPCSGEGLFRRDPGAMQEWSPENAQLCTKRQQRILADVWPSLKEGGILIYSTCTFNPEENEKNIEWLNDFADIIPVELEILPEWGVTQTQAGNFPCYRFYPHKVFGEGFFMAVVRKSGDKEAATSRKIKDNPLWATKVEKEMGHKLINDQNLEILKFEDSLLAFPVNGINELLHIKNNLRIVHAGIKVGEIKQKDLLPAHELALSNILNRGAFSEIKLDLEQALTYLKRDEISPISTNKGWNLITYRNIALGWVKNLGNRYNSAFPKEWRIRMSISEYRGESLQKETEKFPL